MENRLSLKETAVSGLLFLIMFAVFFGLWYHFERPILGDVDGNRKVNQTDLYLASGHVVKSCELDHKQFKAADVNSDGRINSMDLAIIAKQIINVIVTPVLILFLVFYLFYDFSYGAIREKRGKVKCLAKKRS